jgi:membrane fusion protein (multidrug efflux system)
MQKSMINKFLFMALVAGAISSCSGEVSEKDKKKTVFVPLVELQQAQEKTFVHEIKVQGNVETDQEIILNSEMGGLVQRVLVTEGQRVSKGQILATLDVAMITSNQNELKTQLEYAEYMLGKQQELQKRGLGSEFDYETAKNQVASLKSRMRSVSTQKGKSSITAPFSGIIDKVFAYNGAVVGPQSPILRLVNNADVYLTADLSEKHLTSIRVGTPMTVTFPNYNDTSMLVEISSVGNYIEPSNRTFRVRADISKNNFLLPNMLAELKITDLSIDKALVIPSRSIIKDQNNEDFVYIAKAHDKNKFVVEQAKVEVISKYEGMAYVKVLKGKLKSGVSVVTAGAKGIAALDTVRTK